MEVVLLEAAPADSGDGHELNHGSSGGESRITRVTDGRPHIAAMCKLSWEAWDAIEEESGETLVDRCGILELGSKEMLQEIAEASAGNGPMEFIDGQEVRRRWPGFAGIPAEMPALFSPHGGLVNPVKCITTLRSLAMRRGAQLRFGERLVAARWDAARGCFELRTQPAADVEGLASASSVYTCEQVVLTAGSWLRPCLKLFGSLDVPLKVAEVTYGWYEVAPSAVEEMTKLPVWRHFGEPRGYGFPIRERRNYVKVAPFWVRDHRIFESTEERENTPDMDNLAEMDEGVQQFFGASLAGQREPHTKTCLYTVCRDMGFIIDSHPEHPPGRVVICGGFSGSGFKHMGFAGSIATEMLQSDGRCERLDLEPFRITRRELYDD